MPFSHFLSRLLIRTGLARLLPRVRRLLGDGTAFLRYYSDRVLTAPHAELIAAGRLLEYHEPDGIDLALGAPRLDLAAALRPGPERRGYPPPWGLPELREAVAARLSAEHRLSVNPAQQVFITHGCAGALHAVLAALVNPGEGVVLFDPTSPLYPLALKQRGSRIRWVPTTLDSGRVRFAPDRLAHALRRARLLVLADPVNPTGGTFAAEDFEQIAWWANRHDALILVDESFTRFRYEGERVPLGSLRAQTRLLVTGSVSKGHGLAGLRIGWLSGHRHLVRPCALLAAPQTMGVSTLCQQVALTALQQDEATFEPVRATFDARRRYVRERLTALGLEAGWPSGAFFFWVPVGPLGLTGRAFAEQFGRAKKVLVTPGEMFGPSGEGYVRLSYATDDGRLREGLTRLADFVRQFQGAPAAQRAA
ncbi:MAG: pyridoxal phosphate-dependent aminotransferase [Gemmataceae bacterium]|nr:pyridoxal phosphate-dependent aminotransferase [Gemmataceae bacterium]